MANVIPYAFRGELFTGTHNFASGGDSFKLALYTSNPYGAAYYSYNPYLYRAAIKMTNPYKIDSEEVYLKVEEHGNAVNFREYLKNEGYDGVIIDFGNKNEYVTFYSDQVNVFEAKSLLKNKNTIKNKP